MAMLRLPDPPPTRSIFSIRASLTLLGLVVSA
jgi:hypothetical protein